MPEFDACMECEQKNPNHRYTVGEHSLKSMEEIEADKVLRLTMLLHDIGKPVCKETDEEGIDHFHGHNEKSYEISKEILRRLKFDNATIDLVSRFCRYHDVRIAPDKKSMRKTINRLGEDLFPGFFSVQRADVLAQSDLNREGKLGWIEKNEEYYASGIKEGECVSLKDLAFTGKDLIEAGIRPGKEIGEILNSMLNCVLEDPKNNEKSRLFELCLPKTAENGEK